MKKNKTVQYLAMAALVSSCLSALPALADSTEGDPDSSLRVDAEAPAPDANSAPRHHHRTSHDDAAVPPINSGTGNDGTPHIGASNGPPPGDNGGPLPGDRMGTNDMPPPGGGGVPRLSGGDDK